MVSGTATTAEPVSTNSSGHTYYNQTISQDQNITDYEDVTSDNVQVPSPERAYESPDPIQSRQAAQRGPNIYK